MQGCRSVKLLVGAMLALATIGCASSGRQQASKSGPSPLFGLTYVPQQSEPAAESVADAGTSPTAKNGTRTAAVEKSGSQGVVTANFEEPADAPSGNTGNPLMNWMANREKQAPRKPLPLSSSTPVAGEDEQ